MADAQKNGRFLWVCECKCRQIFRAIGKDLVSGNTKSCGCWQKERTAQASLTHGATKNRVNTAEYSAWRGIITRCTNSREPCYKNYGGRGITVCDRWRENFAAFLEDIGLRPSPEHSIDRYPDNDGNYEPSNVRWATRRDQCRNRRSNRWLTFKNETKIVAEWAEITGLGRSCIRHRLSDLGWSVEKALTTPVARSNRKKKGQILLFP